jgi:hypothetical protein
MRWMRAKRCFIEYKWAGCARKGVSLGTNALGVREKVFYWSQIRWIRAKRLSFGTKALDVREGVFY